MSLSYISENYTVDAVCFTHQYKGTFWWLHILGCQVWFLSSLIWLPCLMCFEGTRKGCWLGHLLKRLTLDMIVINKIVLLL